MQDAIPRRCEDNLSHASSSTCLYQEGFRLDAVQRSRSARSNSIVIRVDA